MKKILLIGKMNEVVKDLNAFLSKRFHVQLCSDNPSVAEGMLSVVGPDIVIISLVGAITIDAAVFKNLAAAHEELPVLTIGTESERNHFLKFYENSQFENLIRPIDNSTLLDAIVQKLSLSPEECLVFEDSFNGIRASHAAGCISVMVIDLMQPDAEIKGLTDHIFPDMKTALDFFQSV